MISILTENSVKYYKGVIVWYHLYTEPKLLYFKLHSMTFFLREITLKHSDINKNLK